MSTGSSRLMISMRRTTDFRRVAREADDVAAIGDAPVLAPLEQKLAVVRNVVLLLLRREKIVRVDVFQADEHPLDARRRRLLDEAGDLVAGRVDLDDEARVEALLSQLDQPVENRLPVAVAGEVVVGDEEIAHAVGLVRAHDLFDVVGGAVARLAPLDVDNGAERAEERAAAAGVEARDHADRVFHVLARHDRVGRAVEVRQVVEIIVDRLQLTGRAVAEDIGETAFGLTGEQRNAEIERLFQRVPASP